ncbi:MAG: nucleotidyl transferase AbiEii/AbiGii toxin family protein [Spirochaetales bacterium]|nr:nucleotidyl transferase AbiEii/AbiGii toxin family protein [Spirochaetales bacterium]
MYTELIKYPDSVDSRLLNVLDFIMSQESLAAFALAGGTSLALRFGHRSSEDLDCFSLEKFNSDALQAFITDSFPDTQVLNRTAGSLCVEIHGLKVDFLHHPFPLLEKVDISGQNRFLSVSDISAMKINAVTNRGSKKDFFDIYLLHTIGMSISADLENFRKKYNGNTLLALRSLVWFEDADAEPDPRILNGWTWDLVKTRISELVDTIIVQ